MLLFVLFISFIDKRVYNTCCMGNVADSPGLPPSAACHDLFRGFSYIAPVLLDVKTNADGQQSHNCLTQVSMFVCSLAEYFYIKFC
jgi:hypothetical protein